MPPSTKVLVSDPFSAWKRLSVSVYLYEPPTKSGNTLHERPPQHNIDLEQAAAGPAMIPLSPLDPIEVLPLAPCPRLIILFTWMAAQPTHIFKYIQAYQTLYPSARMLLIRTSAPDALYRRTRTQCRNLQPAISFITSCCPNTTVATADKVTDNVTSNLLIHIFSNGGSLSARNLLQTYLSTTSCPFPLHATILDSCPGRTSFSRTVLALSSALPPSPFLRLPLLLLIYVFIGIYWLISAPLGMSNPIKRLREALNDKRLVHETRRCYIYSEEDPMVSWRAVEDHARDAQAQGFVARTEKFQGSGHCAHARVEGGKRYWQLVDETWRGSVV